MPDTDIIHTYKLCAGSNLENAEDILTDAIDALCARFSCAIQTKIKKTAAIGIRSCTHFHNVGIMIRTELNAVELKEILDNTEKDFGRTKSTSSVALDIDIIAMDEAIIHPDYRQREYVRELMLELDATTHASSQFNSRKQPSGV